VWPAIQTTLSLVQTSPSLTFGVPLAPVHLLTMSAPLSLKAKGPNALYEAERVALFIGGANLMLQSKLSASTSI
jgi:hypothetical protein